MLISIIVPYHNREAFLTDTLRSFYTQTYRPIELLLVDNNSTDTSLQICQDFYQEFNSETFKIRLLSAPSLGAAKARNIGLYKANGEYVYFFDSDDILSRDFLEDVNQYILNNKGVDLIACKTRMVYPSGEIKTRHGYYTKSIVDQILTGMLSTQSMVLKKDFLIAIGGWNNTLRKWDDWELGVRVLKNNPSVGWIKNKAYHSIYQHTDSLTGSSFSERLDDTIQAINTVENLVKESSKAIQSLLARKTILAGYLWREKNTNKAEELFIEVLESSTSMLNGYLFKLLYFYIRIGGKGGWWLFRTFSFLWKD